MHVTYRDSLKCQTIYETNKSMKRILRSKVLKYAIDNIDQYPQLKSDILAVVKMVASSWRFDGLITDMPWLASENILDTTIPSWNLKKFENTTERGCQ